jgi:hypothetical protein
VPEASCDRKHLGQFRNGRPAIAQYRLLATPEHLDSSFGQSNIPWQFQDDGAAGPKNSCD